MSIVRIRVVLAERGERLVPIIGVLGARVVSGRAHRCLI